MANITYIPAPNVTLLSANWQNSSNTLSSASGYWVSNYTTTNLNSAKWISDYTTVNSKSSYWDSVYTTGTGNSSYWSSVYTTVRGKSGDWGQALETSNSLTNKVTALMSASGQWDNAYTFATTASSTIITLQGVSGNSNLYSILTSFTANPVFDTLTVNNSANIHILSVDRLGVGVKDPKYPVHIVGDTVIQGDLTAGNVHFLNTITSTTTALSVVNYGTQTAGVIRQYGDLPVVEFYDGNDLSFFIDGNSDRPGYVGVKTVTPNKELTVVGDISASGSIYAKNIIAAGGGVGSLSDVQTFSGKWTSAYNYLTATSSEYANTSGHWNTAFTYVTTKSGDILTGLASISTILGATTALQSASGDWQTAYTFATGNSAHISNISSASGSWNSVYLSMRGASGAWEAYSPVITSFQTLSSGWEAGYTYATNASAKLLTLQGLSSKWNNVSTYVQNISDDISDLAASSGKWNQAYSDTLGGKVKWNQAYSYTTTSSAALDNIKAVSAFWSVASINFTVDGGGGLISTGRKGFFTVPSNFIINQWEVVADVNCTLVFDVLSSSYSSYPTKVSIVGEDFPQTTNAQKNINSSLTTWNNISADTVLEVNVTSNDNASFATLMLKGNRVN